jgi:hypothetical protein
MRERVLAAALLSLPPLYVTASLIGPLSAGDLAVPFALLVTVAISVGAGWPAPRPRGYALLLTILLVGALVVAGAAEGTSSSAALGLAAGTLLGLPWFASVQTWRPGLPLGGRIVAFGASTLLGLVYLATAGSLGGPGGTWSAGDFLSALGSSTVREGQGIASLFVFGPTSPPVASFFDPLFAGLTGLGVLALLLYLVRPQTGEEVPLPIALRGASAAEAELPAVYGFSEDQLAVYRGRARDDAPDVPWPPGLDAVVAAGIVTGIFLGAAIYSPYYAVAGLVLALVAGVAVVLVATARPAPFEPPKPPPAEPLETPEAVGPADGNPPVVPPASDAEPPG